MSINFSALNRPSHRAVESMPIARGDFYLYGDNQPGAFFPVDHVHVEDEMLTHAETTERGIHSLNFIHDGVAVIAESSHGDTYLGVGHTEEQARGVALIQAIRHDHWALGLPFIPSVHRDEVWVVDSDECVPTRFARIESPEDIEEYQGVDEVWCVEYAPSQFTWSHDFVDAINKLIPHLPQSWRVH